MTDHEKRFIFNRDLIESIDFIFNTSSLFQRNSKNIQLQTKLDSSDHLVREEADVKCLYNFIYHKTFKYKLWANLSRVHDVELSSETPEETNVHLLH